MLVFNISDFAENAPQILDASLNDEVLINDKGKQYKIIPVNNNAAQGRSPLENIPYITAEITTQEIVELIRENRAGA